MISVQGERKKMNKVWVVIRLGRWYHKATSMFLYDRVYKNGDKWTPFCLKYFRYVGGYDGEIHSRW